MRLTHTLFASGLLLCGSVSAAEPQLLWSQYGLANDTLKLSAHTDADPLKPTEAKVTLWFKAGGDWERSKEAPIDPLTAMAEFRIDDWDTKTAREYRMTCGDSEWSGTVRAEPKEGGVLKLMASACVNDTWFPYTKAVAQILEQNPDILFFAGDQLYEGNSGGEIIVAETEADVPAAMANYLAKWRKFGLIYRELLKDRPSVMVTDDHDVYADDLWGRGGKRMVGERTNGGYQMHPKWVNAAERAQMWNLPDAAAPGPWGDGIHAYFTSLDYGGVSFAILEDRKFKSAPSEVLSAPVHDPRSGELNDTLEVIKDPDFDAKKLDRPDLQLLGEVQEKFVAEWAREVARKRRLSAVLSQSPYVNVGNYEPHFGDMDSNGWPQTARNRALRAIAPSQAVMIGGDIHYGTLLQHGIDTWGDGPWSYSVPAFASKQNRRWNPTEPAQGGEVPGVAGSGNHHDRFGNKLTLVAKADGFQGYGMILFDKDRMQTTLELHTFDANREPKQVAVPGWPKVIDVKWPETPAWKKHLIQPATRGAINGTSASDFDGDGHMDVIASLGGEVVLYRGPDWTPHTVHTFAPGQSRNKPRTACIHSCLMDADGDGDMDFIGSNNTVFWLECPDAPFSGEPWTYRTVDDEILGTHCLITGDVNRDGKLDLIANSGSDEKATRFPQSITWIETPADPHTAKSWVRHVFADKDAPGGSHYMGFGDVNDDGRPDIACAAKGTDNFTGGQWFAWWEQPEDPTTTWKKHLLAENQEGATNIIPADLDEDGHTDYFATRGHGKGVLWFRGPDFEQIEIDPDIAYPHSLALADMNGDGHIDAVTCGKEADGIAAWYENDGKGGFTRHVIGTDQGSYDTRTVDMDGDGDLDVLIAGHSSKNLVWFENPNPSTDP